MKEGGYSTNDEKNDNTEGCGAGEVLDARGTRGTTNPATFLVQMP